MLYSIFTYDCTANDDGTSVIKFADDTTICGYIKDNNETSYREQIDSTLNWCKENNLELNVTKTKELVIDFRKSKNEKASVIINGQSVEQVDSFKLLGTFISNDLKWHVNSVDIVKKARQRLYFLRVLKSFKVHQSVMISFYRGIIESVLTRSICVWFGSASKKDIDKMNSVIRSAEKLIGVGLPSLHAIYNDRSKKRTESIMKDECHPANYLFEMLRSGRRLRSFYGNKRFVNSFYPMAVRIFNCS
jgi:hypothetical protein